MTATVIPFTNSPPSSGSVATLLAMTPIHGIECTIVSDEPLFYFDEEEQIDD